MREPWGTTPEGIFGSPLGGIETSAALRLIDSQYGITFAVVGGVEGMPVGTIV